MKLGPGGAGLRTHVPSSGGMAGSSAALVQSLAGVAAPAPRRFAVLSSRRTVGILPAPDVRGAAPAAHLSPGEVLPDAQQLVPFDAATGSQMMTAACTSDVASTRTTSKRNVFRQPLVPRPRRRCLKGGPANGVVVHAMFRRSTKCSRGYSLQAGFAFPDGRTFRGSGAKRRILEVAPNLAPRLFIVYRTLQCELLREWERQNAWSDKKQCWRRRTTGPLSLLAPTGPRGCSLRIARKRPTGRGRSDAPREHEEAAQGNVLAVMSESPRELCDVPRAICDGPLALCDGPLALRDAQTEAHIDAVTPLQVSSKTAVGKVVEAAATVAAERLAACSVGKHIFRLLPSKESAGRAPKPVSPSCPTRQSSARRGRPADTDMAALTDMAAAPAEQQQAAVARARAWLQLLSAKRQRCAGIA